MEKRKSATDFFMEQQKISIEDEEFEPVVQSNEFNANISSGGNIPLPKRKKSRNLNLVDLKSSEELQLEKEPIKVRITGFGIWKRVIVPPNAYVIHTRIGKSQPVTIGLGISFRYNPNKCIVSQGC